MKKLITFCLIAFALWFLMFSPATKHQFNFWIMMTISAGGLGTAGLYFQRNKLDKLFNFKWQYIPAGIFFAVMLYMIFYFGNAISTKIFPFAANQIENIYLIGTGIDKLKIGTLLMLIIAPGEEIFWRGYVQDRLSQKYSPIAAVFIATAIYTLVHIWSLNFMLIAAAGICGLFWAILFYRFKNLWIPIISHAVWDVAIFLLWPIGTS